MLKLYNEFICLSRERTFLCENIFEILLPQLLKYFEDDDSVSCPIKFDLCFEYSGATPHLMEPFPYLLAAICSCYIAQHESLGSFFFFFFFLFFPDLFFQDKINQYSYFR